jgi:hypothetical protein
MIYSDATTDLMLDNQWLWTKDEWNRCTASSREIMPDGHIRRFNAAVGHGTERDPGRLEAIACVDWQIQEALEGRR